MGECMTTTLRKMIRISVAEGLKRMYKEYRLQKWLKVQEMAKTVRRVLEAEITPAQHLPQPEYWTPAEHLPQPSNDQIVPAQNSPQLYLQPQNVNLQMPLPGNHNLQPDNFIHLMVSPVNRPYPQVISPIQTPNGTDIIINSSRPSIEATPNEFHQFSITNISPGENPLVSRQLFEESIDNISAECDISSAVSESHDGMVILENLDVNVHTSSSVSGQSLNFETVENQSVIYPVIQQEQQEIYNEHLDESDEDMDWDPNDSSYNESEESLAGVLFAAEHLLPDEQAVRLDVEMGDMGIGHMVFDRVSATWYTSHCEFYRAH